MLKKSLPPFVGYLVCFVIVCVLLFSVANIWRTLHPKPVQVSDLQELADKVDLTFPPQTTLLNGRYVTETNFPATWSYGIVRMPVTTVPRFLKQATIIPNRPDEVNKLRKWLIEAPMREDFISKDWNFANVRHYKVVYYAGAGGQIFIDLDNPIAAKVYILSCG